MAITLIQPLAAGNALRLFISPPRGAVYWRVLRRTADIFAGPYDAGAVLVADKNDDNVILDTLALENGIPVFYRCYSWNGTSWDNPASRTATPAATYQGDDCDVVQILRDRLAEGLAVEVARGTLLPVDPIEGAEPIPVVLAPFMLAERVRFPMVSIHLDSFAPTERALGEDISGGAFDEADGFAFTEGFRARVQVNIAGVSRLPDERNALRRCLVRILQANFPVFAAAGIDLPEFSFGDSEQLEDKAAPIFLTAGSFTCQVSSFVIAGHVPPIADVLVHPAYLGMEPPPQ